MKWLLFVSLFFSIGAQAQNNFDYSFTGKNYTITYKLKNTHQEIVLMGVILSGVVEDLTGYKQVQKLLRPNMDIRVVLHSGGGYQKLFNKLSASLKKACNKKETGCEITTIVPSRYRCASACIPFFMTGDVRIAGRNAVFGFHQSAVIPGALKISGKAERDLLNSGVNAQWLEKHKHMFDTLDMTYLYPNQMNGSNIITRIVN